MAGTQSQESNEEILNPPLYSDKEVIPEIVLSLDKRTEEEKEIKNPLDVVQEEVFGYQTLFESIPSKPYNSLNVREIENASAEFVYNYFTPKEREINPVYQINANAVIASQNEDLLFLEQHQKDQTPMFVKINFELNANTNLTSLSEVKSEINYYDALFMTNESIFKSIITEENLSNKFFTGVEFIDTLADSKIYSMLSSSIVFKNSGLARDSLTTKADSFLSDIGISQEFSPASKIELMNILSNIQSETSIINDAKGENVKTLADPITQQAVSTKFSNLFISDILNFTTLNKNNVFSDEMVALSNVAAQKNIQGKNISISKSRIKGLAADDYEMQVKPFHLRDFFIDLDEYDISDYISQFESEIINYPKIRVMGVIVQKVEITNDNIVRRKMFYFDDPENLKTTFFDQEVKYGSVYIYKIRTLSVVDTIYHVNNTEDSTRIFVGKYLIASSGKTIPVDCVENIPPPPPSIITFNVNPDYQKPEIFWQYPFNPQRDIKKFQVFKRKSIEDPFILIKEYNFDNSDVKANTRELAFSKNIEMLQFPKTSFIDLDFNLKKETAIYALGSVDAHGLGSNYSPQFKIKYDVFNNQLDVTRISQSGAPKPYPNLFLDQDFFSDSIKTSGYKRCNIFFDPECYQVLKPEQTGYFGSTYANMNFIKFTNENDAIQKNELPYVFHMINVDNHLDKKIEFRIVDKSGRPENIESAALIQENNLSFEFGVE